MNSDRQGQRSILHFSGFSPEIQPNRNSQGHIRGQSDEKEDILGMNRTQERKKVELSSLTANLVESFELKRSSLDEIKKE